MFLNFFIILLFSLILFSHANVTIVKGDKIASNEPHIFATCVESLGCLDTNEKWYHPKYRPVNLEPLDRNTIRTEFFLFKSGSGCNNTNNETKNDKDILFDIISNQNPDTAKVAGYKDCGCLKLLVHDFTASGHAGWIKHMAKAFLVVNPCNVVSVNWEAGAEPPFDQAIANARVVALEIYAFIRMLQEHFHLDVKHEIQIVGHGVGAHIAGYVGKALQKTLPKITGLDPTGARFENMPPVVRLDVDDAKFVEVLHTDAYNSRSQGTMQPLGRVDYYLNNAGHQPGCNDTWQLPKFTEVTRDVLQEGKILPACSHKRAYKYYISAAINKECPFIGIPCESYEKFMNGSCTDCRKSQCLIMRYDSFSSDVPKNTKVFLNTNSEPPFCMHTYEIAISVEKHDKMKKLLGFFEFILVDENNKVSFASPSIDGTVARTFLPGFVHYTIAYAPPPEIDKIKEAKVKWRNTSKFNLKNKSIYVKYITIMRVSEKMNAPVNGLCPEEGPEIKNRDFVHFNKCDVSKFKHGEVIAGAAESGSDKTAAASGERKNYSKSNSHEGTSECSSSEETKYPTAGTTKRSNAPLAPTTTSDPKSLENSNDLPECEAVEPGK
ncbi:pancreatic lipase-related protein 2-like isoform X1 [Onthophagus taurus]|uniref:pancreatic lipase-related protein 2-like isoform X1 n=2 Tax=Onthophagus taurus TaxID=166361 RepID=UPI0039BEB54D